jgi:hypothetical protein
MDQFGRRAIDCDGKYLRGAKVRERIHAAAIGSRRYAGRPYQVRDKEDNYRLVQSVEHIHPKFGSSILEPKHTPFIQLGEGHRSFRIQVLIESYEARIRIESVRVMVGEI